MHCMKTNMTVFSAVADEAFVRNLVIQGVSHEEITDIYRSQYPHMRGLTEISVRRYCKERSIHRISKDELDLIVEQHIRLYGHSYGQKNPIYMVCIPPFCSKWPLRLSGSFLSLD